MLPPPCWKLDNNVVGAEVNATAQFLRIRALGRQSPPRIDLRARVQRDQTRFNPLPSNLRPTRAQRAAVDDRGGLIRVVTARPLPPGQ